MCIKGPVLIRGLGRFLELKDMARQAAEAKAAVEAKVFITQPKQPTAPFTTPQPFRLGPEVPLGYEARRRRAQVGGIGGWRLGAKGGEGVAFDWMLSSTLMPELLFRGTGSTVGIAGYDPTGVHT